MAMTYKEIKARLDKCEHSLEQLRSGKYSQLNKSDVEAFEKNLNLVKESLTKQLKEAEKNVLLTTKKGETSVLQEPDDDTLRKLKTDPNVQKIKSTDGTEIKEQEAKFNRAEIQAISKKVGQGVLAAHKKLGEQMRTAKASKFTDNGFTIEVIFKNGSESEYNFYIDEDTLMYDGRSYDEDVCDVGVLPSGEAVVNVNVIEDKFSSILNKILQENMKEGAIQDLEQELLSLDKGAQITGGGYGPFVKHSGKSCKNTKTGKFITCQALAGFLAGFNDVKIVDAQNVNEAPEGMYYIKVAVRDARKALAIIDDRPDLKHAVEISGSDTYYLTDEELAYDLKMDFAAHDIEVVDSSEELEEAQSHPVMVQQRIAHAKKAKQKERDKFAGSDPNAGSTIKGTGFDWKRKDENVTQKHIDDIEASGNIDIAYKKAMELLKSMLTKDEALDHNDPVLMRARVAKMRANDLKKLDQLKSNDRANAKVRAIIDKLKAKRAQVEREMENDPNIEPEGGPTADHYGEILNKIDTAIEKAALKIKKVNELFDEEDFWRSEKEKEQEKYGLKPGEKPHVEGTNESIPTVFDDESMSALYNIILKHVPNSGFAEKELQKVEDGGLDAMSPELISQLEKDPEFEKWYHKLHYGSATDTDYMQRRKETQDYVKENESEDQGGDLDIGHQDDEPDMLKQYAYDIASYASKLYKHLDKYDKMDGEVDFPNWWQSKVILARDYISKAQHYLEFEEKQPAIDQLALEGTVTEGMDGQELLNYFTDEYVLDKHFHSDNSYIVKREPSGKDQYVIFDYDEGTNKFSIRQMGGYRIDQEEAIKAGMKQMGNSRVAGIDTYMVDGNYTPTSITAKGLKDAVDHVMGGLSREAQAQQDFYANRGRTSGTIDEGTDLYDRNGIHIKRFAGKDGVMVQITVPSQTSFGGDYIQVSAEEYPFLVRAMQSVQDDLKDMSRQVPRKKNMNEDSLANIERDLDNTLKDIQTHLQMYKDAEGDEAKKAAVQMLKKLNDKKKDLLKQKVSAIAGMGKDQELSQD